MRTFVLVFRREKSFTNILRISKGNAGVVESPLAVEAHNASEFTWGLFFFLEVGLVVVSGSGEEFRGPN